MNLSLPGLALADLLDAASPGETLLLISLAAIYLTLVFQFKNAIKPFVVFAAVPYGLAGGLVALWIMDTPFGFMAFLGIVTRGRRSISRKRSSPKCRR